MQDEHRQLHPLKGQTDFGVIEYIPLGVTRYVFRISKYFILRKKLRTIQNAVFRILVAAFAILICTS